MARTASTSNVAGTGSSRGPRRPQSPRQIQGAVEQLDLASGIRGWALDVNDLAKRLSVELLVGERTVSRVNVDHPRDNLLLAPGQTLRAGFAFPAEAHDGLRDLLAAGQDGRLTIRVCETGTELPISSGAARLLRSLRSPDQLFTEADGLDMIAHLAALRARTTALASQPLIADGPNLSGYIEQLSIDEAGLVWFSGWMKHPIAANMPAVIVDGQQLAAGMAMTMFTREDLGGDARGMIGVIFSDWRPTTSSEMMLFLDGGPSYLQCLRDVKTLSKREFAEHLAFQWPHCESGHSNALRHLLDHPSSWSPTEGLSSAKVRASLEQVYVLPNFGCLVTGWVLSPIKSVEGFALKFGSTILKCDPDSVSFRPRADLIPLAAGCDLLTERAGFVAVFRGLIDRREIDDATLKIHLSDGSSSNHIIDTPAIRRLGHAASIRQLLHLYPSLTSEPFFPDFAMALRQDCRVTAEKLTPVSVKCSQEVLICTISEERSDAFFLFDELEQRMLTEPSHRGLVFVAGRGSTRPAAIALFKAFEARVDNPCSLYLVDDPNAAFYAISGILTDVGAENFAFFGAGLVPDEEGWSAAIGNDGGLALLEILDPAISYRSEFRSLECFCWNRAAFMAWLATAPSFVNGPRTTIDDLVAEVGPDIVERGAWLLRRDMAPHLTRAVNSVAAFI